jgi:hypothetical protein
MVSDLILHNPLDDDFPNDPVDRVHRLARDLAWGALNKLWDVRVEVRGGRVAPLRGSKGGMLPEYLDRWGERLPPASLLVAFGYLEERTEHSPSGARMRVGTLTLDAFARLKKPPRTPQVYISYSREESSALALLTVARLQMAGVENPFIDMNHNPGDMLHAEQEARVRRSDYMVCLLAPTTLDSDYVCAEIDWALSTDGLNIIPVWHNGFAPAHDYPPALATRNAIRIEEESAEAYNNAMVRLLNRVGYAP